MFTWSILRQTRCRVHSVGGFSKHFRVTYNRRFVYVRKFHSIKYDVNLGGHCRAPHDKTNCADAYFIWNGPGITAFGVADGVSEWRHCGVDPSLFPNMLMVNCIKYLEEHNGRINLRELFKLAYDEIIKTKDVEAGSSTACLGVLDQENGRLETLNLGDSGFSIFRKGETFYKSQEQYHELNRPFQIGVEMIDGDAKALGNSANDAFVRSFHVEDDDLIIFGTDGLFDNMYPRDIYTSVYSPHHDADYNIKSRHLTREALERSVDAIPGSITPREERLRKNDDSLTIPGGNFDDVTAVIVHVRK